MSSTLKDYYPVRREQGLSSLDVAVIGDTVQGLVAAAALTQLDFLTIKVRYLLLPTRNKGRIQLQDMKQI